MSKRPWQSDWCRLNDWYTSYSRIYRCITRDDIHASHIHWLMVTRRSYLKARKPFVYIRPEARYNQNFFSTMVTGMTWGNANVALWHMLYLSISKPTDFHSRNTLLCFPFKYEMFLFQIWKCSHQQWVEGER